MKNALSIDISRIPPLGGDNEPTFGIDGDTVWASAGINGQDVGTYEGRPDVTRVRISTPSGSHFNRISSSSNFPNFKTPSIGETWLIEFDIFFPVSNDEADGFLVDVGQPEIDRPSVGKGSWVSFSEEITVTTAVAWDFWYKSGALTTYAPTTEDLAYISNFAAYLL